MTSGRRIGFVAAVALAAMALGQAAIAAKVVNTSYEALEAQDAKVKAAVPSYTVKPDLSNVANLKTFSKALDRNQIAMIARNRFVVSPTDYSQMFHIYENNEYQRPRKLGAFITTDSMLHTYHVFYDYSLRKVESGKLSDILIELTDAMLKASQNDYAAASDPLVKDAARRNLAYFAVARKLLGGQAPPSSVSETAQADLKRIEAHAGRDLSSVLGHKMDFSQFVPRGHYTRSENLKRFFKAMMWYGLSPLPVPQGAIGVRPTVQSLLIVRSLRMVSDAKGRPALRLWETIYEPTAFYVGVADDYTVYDYSRLMDRIYGKAPGIQAFADKGKLANFIAEVNKLEGPGIENSVDDPLFPTGRQFRFMGQRFIADSRILQEMSHPKVSQRYFPRGLDVLAATGSERALAILTKSYGDDKFAGYSSQMANIRREMSRTPRKTWQSNLYYGWLWTLQSLMKPAPKGYPSFMQGSAWQDKSLLTALGSWTELRHDTILYGKQSVAECGGADEPVPVPKGYVEPNLEFWSKLKWLNAHTKEGLSRRGLLNAELADKFSRLGDWMEFCRRISVKELTGKRLTQQEYEQIEMYGAELESLTTSFSDAELLNDEDNDMALVADVHTSAPFVMEEATGHAAEIYVVVPIEGKLMLTRGAVYTQYEFRQPMENRLTDREWQQMLKSKKEPGMGEWMKSFLIKSRKGPAPGFEHFDGGC